MAKKIFVIPAEGCQVRKKENLRTFVKKEGESVPHNIYYKRRINRGELIIPKVKKEKSVSKKEK